MKLFSSIAAPVLALFAALSATSSFAAVGVTIGQNFISSTYNLNSTALPPDCNGAVGPNHYVEFINGNFTVYNKTNGSRIRRISDTSFWTSVAHVNNFPSGGALSDPRIIYDPVSQRWFASQIDLDPNASDPTSESNDFLVGASVTSDPSGAWQGFLFVADPDTGYFADFPTLGVDSNAVYLSGDLYLNSVAMGVALVSIPKAQMLVDNVDNRKWYGVLDYGQRGEVMQPAICTDGSTTGALLAVGDIGNDSAPHSNVVYSIIQNGAAGTNATLAAPIDLTVTPHTVPDNADLGVPQFSVNQPDGTSALLANDARISAKVYAVGGVLYVTYNTELNNRLAILWHRVRASDGTVLEMGTISDPNLDLFFPSIAANALGTVVISYNSSGPGSFVNCNVIAGQTVNGKTSFGPPTIVAAGVTSYHGDDEVIAQILGGPVVSRWGDYSSTSPDPNDPNTFWTIQMFPSDSANNDVWSTEITQVITAPLPVLSIAENNANSILSWSSAVGAYHLLMSTNLTLSNAWNRVSQPPSTNAGVVMVSVPQSGSQQFFRLSQGL